MTKEWTKFQYDDGAEVYYKISKENEMVEFKIDNHVEEKQFELFFDEIESVYKHIKALK